MGNLHLAFFKREHQVPPPVSVLNALAGVAHTEWGVTRAMFQLGVSAMRSDRVPVASDKDAAALLFLYVKRVLANEDADVRRLVFCKLFDTGKYRSIDYNEARLRLLRMLSEHRQHHQDDGNNNKVQSFEDFVKANPAWAAAASGAFVCHRDDPKLGGGLVQRAQKPTSRTELSHLAAPVVLQQYVRARMHGTPPPTEDSTPADAYVLLQRLLEPWELELFIFNRYEDPLASCRALRHLLPAGFVLTSESLACTTPASLLHSGPLLLAGFQVHDDFMRLACQQQQQPHQFTGKPRGRIHGAHAMLIIGVRTTTDNNESTSKKHFLLQNWWARGQFVDVAESYLEFCEPAVWSAKPPSTHIISALPPPATTTTE